VREVVSGLLRDVRLALRQMRRHPMLAIVTIGIIAFSVGAAAAVFAVADGALIRPLPFTDGDRMYFVTDTQGEDAGLPASLPELRDWETNSTAFSSLAAFHGVSYVFDGGRGAEVLPGAAAFGDAAATLGIAPLLGRWFTAEEQRTGARVALLGESFWREQYGGRADVLGETIRLDNAPVTIVGVVPAVAGVIRAGRAPAVWVPAVERESMSRGLHFLSVVGRLRPGVTPAQATAAMGALSAQLVQSGATEHGIGIRSVRETIVGDARRLLVILSAATIVMLLIACANLASLFLSRSLEQTQEFAVRTALGARPWRLARQTLVETVVTGAAGGVLALGFARLCIGVIAGLARRAGTLAPPSVLDIRVAAFTLLTAITAGCAFGLWPTLRASRNDPASFLRGGARGTAARSTVRGRRILVAAEIALSLVLLTQAGLLVRSMLEVLRQDPGFNADNVMTMTIALRGERFQTDASQLQFAASLQDRLTRVPGVIAAGVGSNLPLDGSDTNGSFIIVGRDTTVGEVPSSKKRVASNGYFRALGIPVRRGRDFDVRDRAGSADVVIISEAVAKKYWPGSDPVGQRIRFGWGPGDEQTVVGVVGDVRSDGLDVAIEQGSIYRPAAQFPLRNLSVAVRAARVDAALVTALRQAVRELDPSVPAGNIQSMREVVSTSTSPRRTLMLLLAGLATIALLISAVGVYAITAHAVARRTAEVGIRMALGARQIDVLQLVMREEMGTVAAGLVLGAAGALASARLLQASLYGIGARDPVTFAAVAALLALAAGIAALLPARRATRIPATTALRGS
jgi:predicted permease